MKLSQRAVEVLENFSTINNGIVIKKTEDGETSTRLRVMDPDGFIIGEAMVDDVFPHTVKLADLSSFLAVKSAMGEDAEVIFEDRFLQVKNDSSVSKIVYSESNLIIYPDKDPVLPESDLTFSMKQSDLAKVLNTGKLLSLPHIKVISKDGKVYLQAVNARHPNSNTFDAELSGVVKTNGDFHVYFKRENIKMLPGDYKVEVFNGKVAKFTNEVDNTLVYYTALEKID